MFLRVPAAVFLFGLFTFGCDAPKPVTPPSGKSVTGQILTESQSKEAAKVLADAKSGTTQAKAGTKSGLTRVALLLNWYPEAEHGGFYAAQVHGIYEKFGLDVEIRPGGKLTLVPPELEMGRIQFGVANADDVLIARNQGVPMVALMAPIQNGPRCIMVRKDSGIRSFADLKNMTLQIDKTRPYVPFLKSKGFLQEGIEIVPFFGTVDRLVASPGVGTQGYSFSEPFSAQQKGVEVTQLMMSDIGYNPYCSLLVTTDPYMANNAEVCQKMTQASIEGWKKYLQSPTESNSVILSKNKQGLEKNALEFGVEALKPLCYTSKEGDDSLIGAMTEQRWSELASTLIDLKRIDRAKVDAAKAFTTKYLPR
jgi:NitT/TauT family transport system substrate-binding protein